MKKVLFILMAVSFLFLASGQTAQAQNANDEKKAAEETVKPQNVGNKICPVSGERIGEDNGAGMTPVTYEYEGKIYNFCCPMCIAPFKKDPQKYIKKVEEELQAEGKQETETMPASKNPTEMPAGDHE